MKWGLGMIGGACAALVLGIAIVAPTSERARVLAPTPTEQALVGSSWTALPMTRSLVPVPEPPPEPDSGKPAEEPLLSPALRADETAEAPGSESAADENRDPDTVGETSSVRDD